jgi:DivIVA domain-containing protein
LILLFQVLAVLAVVFGVAVLVTGRAEGLSSEPQDLASVGIPRDRPMTSEDVLGLRFALALRGYRMDEVDDALDRLAAEIAARDEAIRRLRAGLEAAHVRLGGAPADAWLETTAPPPGVDAGTDVPADEPGEAADEAGEAGEAGEPAWGAFAAPPVGDNPFAPPPEVPAVPQPPAAPPVAPEPPAAPELPAPPAPDVPAAAAAFQAAAQRQPPPWVREAEYIPSDATGELPPDTPVDVPTTPEGWAALDPEPDAAPDPETPAFVEPPANPFRPEVPEIPTYDPWAVTPRSRYTEGPTYVEVDEHDEADLDAMAEHQTGYAPAPAEATTDATDAPADPAPTGDATDEDEPRPS